MKIDTKQLETLFQAHSKLTEGMASVKEVRELANIFLGMVADIKKYAEKTDRELSGKVNEALRELSERAEKIKRETEQSLTKTATELSRLFSELETSLVRETKSSVDNHLQSMSPLLSKMEESIASMDMVVKRHNDMEMEMSQMHSNMGIEMQGVTDDIKKINTELEQITSKIEDGFKELRKEVSTKTAGSPRRIFQPYIDDFSGDTDGSTKTFYLTREPLKTNTILVWGTDFPVILRPTTDFTVTGRTLTLTDAVPAPSQGATLLIQYHA